MSSSSQSLAVVTGAAGDIGRAIASKLSESHDHVFLVDLNETRARLLASELGTDKFTAIPTDVTDKDQVASMAAEVLARGQLRTLVNNAGAAWAVSLHDMTPEIWKKESTLNSEAAFICFHAFQDALKESRGSVVNIASVNGLSFFGHPAYSAAKAGLIHLTKAIAVEYGRYGVRANAVAPGTVNTIAWDERVKANPKVFEEMMQWYPLKRAIQPADVANAVSFLSSDAAGPITGVCLPVDGGLTAGQTPVAHAFSQSEHHPTS